MICETLHLLKLICQESDSDFHTVISGHIQSSPNLNQMIDQLYQACRQIIDLGVSNSNLSDEQMREKYFVTHTDTMDLHESDTITSDDSITFAPNCTNDSNHNQQQHAHNDNLISTEPNSEVVREKPHSTNASDTISGDNYLDKVQQCVPPQMPQEWQQVILSDQKGIAEYQKSQHSLSNSYLKFAGLEQVCNNMITCTADEIMCETLKLAVKDTNVEVTTSTEEMLDDLKQNVSLKKRYNEFIDSNLRKRLRSDPNYSSENFPNAEEYFKPNQPHQ